MTAAKLLESHWEAVSRTYLQVRVFGGPRGAVAVDDFSIC